MRRRPPRSTRTGTLFPYTTLFRSHVRRAIFIGFKKPTDFPVSPHVPTYHDSHDTDAMLQSRQGPMRHKGKKSIVGRIEGTPQIIFLLSPATAYPRSLPLDLHQLRQQSPGRPPRILIARCQPRQYIERASVRVSMDHKD